MQKFVLEIRCEDGKEYPPNTLYKICCGIMRYIQTFSPKINFFSQPTFASFKKTLDGEMKCLKANGAGIHIKRAQPHDMQEEEARRGTTLGESDFRQSFTTNSTRHYAIHVWHIFCPLQQPSSSCSFNLLFPYQKYKLIHKF